MSLKTHSKFYYGFEITADTQNLDFNEGAAELTATLEIGGYTFTGFVNELSRAINAAGGQTYVVAGNRSTRKITISAAGNFALLVATGSHLGTSVFSIAGFTGADVSGADTYTGNVATGSVYSTQFIIQSHVPSAHQTGPAYGTVNKSASGKRETVTFGTEKFIDGNLMFINDYAQSTGGPIRNNQSGVANALAFLAFAIGGSPFEFMPNEDAPGTFEGVVLEATPEDKNGLRFKLKEMYDRGLPGYYETGLLKFRVVE